jgi:hypothetical protein
VQCLSDGRAADTKFFGQFDLAQDGAKWFLQRADTFA